jgi:hypothetical protein
VTRVEASNELLQILNDLKADAFDGITTGDNSWFHYLYESSAMFAKSPVGVIPRMRKEMNVKETIFTIFLTNRELLIAEYLPKGQKYNQDYSISDILPELEREKMRYKRIYLDMNPETIWLLADAQLPVSVKRTIASEKHMLIVFWGIHEIAHHWWLPKDSTLNSSFFCEK